MRKLRLGWQVTRREELKTPHIAEVDGRAVYRRDGKTFKAHAGSKKNAGVRGDSQQQSQGKSNMLFVPLKTREPHVSAREFMASIFMLVAFCTIHSNQHFREDFHANSGMADMCNMYSDSGFVNIATQGDYAAWFPSLLEAFNTWTRDRDRYLNTTTLPTTGPAVLLGRPLIMQRRLSDASFAINGTAGNECLWAPRDYGLGVGPTCYGAAMGWNGDNPLLGVDLTPGERGDHEVVYLDHIDDILSAGSAWDSTDWIDTATTEILHYFQVWLPTQGRIATVKITASFDRTGRVQPRDREDAPPIFRTQEPFNALVDPRETYGELLFYCVMAYYLWGELMEVWDCICMQELLLPLEILVDAFKLSLYEIQYFHAKTSEVYDPRDPNTHEAFTFPNTDCLERHYTRCIMPIRDTLVREEQQLKRLRVHVSNLARNARSSGETRDEKNYFDWHAELVKQHTKLMQTHKALDIEMDIAETAAILQLAVMWNNRWSMDFPPHYLREVANPKESDDEKFSDDGQKAFCAIDWTEVAEAYTMWTDSGDVHKSVHHRSEGGQNMFKTHRLGIMGEPHINLGKGPTVKSLTKTPQQKHFAQLAPLVDYLNMLRDTQILHQQLVGAKAIKYWNGPKVETSHTIDQAFQQLIRNYNAVGQGLMKEMQCFPQEIMNGFHDPQPIKAETTKINARRIQKDLVTKLNTAQTLGFFFPGSTMWELQRKLRAGGHYNKAANVKHSLDVREEETTLVGSASMALYIKSDDTAGADCTVKYTIPRPKTRTWTKIQRGKNQKSKDKKSKDTTSSARSTVTNPMHEFTETPEGATSDNDDDELEDDAEDVDELADNANASDVEVDRLGVRALLDKVPFLKLVTKDELDDMADGCKICEYNLGDTIIKEGDPDLEHMFVLIKGDAVVKKEAVMHGKGSLQNYRQFELFGERPSKNGRKASVVAKQNGTKCLRFNHHARDVLSKSHASGILDGNYETAGQAARIYGAPGWRDWIPHSARNAVNHDGQFFTEDEGVLKKLSTGSFVYPLWLYVSEGLQTYFVNGWNVIEFALYSLFMVAFYCKIEMWRLTPVLEQAVVQAVTCKADYVDVARFDYLNWLYMMTLTPNAVIMWIK